jgi:hypothetical protein
LTCNKEKFIYAWVQPRRKELGLGFASNQRKNTLENEILGLGSIKRKIYQSGV